MILAGLVEYEGTDFSGWAAQPGRCTVEGELCRALQTVLRHPVKLSVAGRTDAGVHASGQVVSFESRGGMEPQEVAYRATAVLPPDVALRRCVEGPEGFDARRRALSRSYEYRILNSPVRSPLERRRAAFIPAHLEIERLHRCAKLLRGTHDFSAFTPVKSYHVRFERVVTVSRWRSPGDDVLVYEITADSFLYGMVRAVVGTMVEVARGRRSVEDFERLLQGAPRPRAGPGAPARGLTLTGVEYEDLRL